MARACERITRKCHIMVFQKLYNWVFLNRYVNGARACERIQKHRTEISKVIRGVSMSALEMERKRSEHIQKPFVALRFQKLYEVSQCPLCKWCANEANTHRSRSSHWDFKSYTRCLNVRSATGAEVGEDVSKTSALEGE